jgi:hypothetical protein
MKPVEATQILNKRAHDLGTKKSVLARQMMATREDAYQKWQYLPKKLL